jgi:hypothetical protein
VPDRSGIASADDRELPRAFGIALLASAVIGAVIIPSRGHYRADSMVLVFAALGVVAWLLVDLIRQRSTKVKTVLLQRVVPAVLVLFLASALIDSRLLIDLDRPWWTLRVLTFVELLLLASYLRPPSPEGSRWPAIRFALFGLCLGLAMLETVRLSPIPHIDVWTVQTGGARALVEGKNPFEVVGVVDTAPGVLRDDVPYVYPPLQAFLTVPSLLLGDVRFTMGTALLVLGIALRDLTVHSGRRLPALLVDAPALVVWLSPKLLFIFQQAWVDPVQIALISTATALAMRRRVWLSSLAFGLVFASKQTMFWVAPLAFVTFPFFRLRHAVVAGALAVATYVPFVLWNWPALLHANLGFVAGLPSRDDALSFVNWAWRALGVRVPYAIAFPLAATMVGYVVLRRRAEPKVFGIALLVTYFVFFTLNKWTFANYYVSLLGLAALGAAMALHARAPATEATPQPQSSSSAASAA